ncbi:MAG: hypothetical protein ACOCVF_00465 [bacterium]
MKLNKINNILNDLIIKLLIKDFIDYSCEFLSIEEKPIINIIYNEDFATNNKSFGSFDTGNNEISVVFVNRSIADSFRTLSHELCHYKQNIEGRIKDASKDGGTGSDIENEANSTSGIIMRNYGKKHPIIFKLKV